jgi:Amt family ammonium transporter
MTALAWISLAVAALLLRAGFAIYLCGVSRAKTAGSSIFRALCEAAIGILVFWGFGAAILSGSTGLLFGGSGLTSDWLLFPASISLIASGIVTGATLERSRPVVWIAGAILLPGVITPLAWHWAQSHWLMQMGFHDLAGATFIHFAGGIAALVAALAVGARSGKYNRDGSTNAILGHSVPLAGAGVLLMLAAWPACIGGFLFMQSTGDNWGFPAVTGPALWNSILAGAAATVTAMLYSRQRHHKLDVFLVFAGLLGGLVSMTAGADLVSTRFAVLIGAVAGILVPYAAVVLELIFKIDDPAGGIAISGVGGLWGALAAALFAPGTSAEHFHRLMGECVGLALIGALSAAGCAIVFFGLRAWKPIRSSDADEIDGLDLAEHDLNAYPDFSQNMIKSYHLREM